AAPDGKRPPGSAPNTPGTAPAGSAQSASRRAVTLHRRARTEQVPVAPDVVDPPHVRPELALPHPGDREGRLLAAIGTVPGVGHDVVRGVRRHLERVVVPVDPPFVHGAD